MSSTETCRSDWYRPATRVAHDSLLQFKLYFFPFRLVRTTQPVVQHVTVGPCLVAWRRLLLLVWSSHLLTHCS